MKKLSLALALGACTFTAQAACTGAGPVQDCIDAQGHRYTIDRSGSAASVGGHPQRAPMRWEQTRPQPGGNNFQDGRPAQPAANRGRPPQRPGEQQIQWGYDSRNGGYSRSCSAGGCIDVQPGQNNKWPGAR